MRESFLLVILIMLIFCIGCPLNDNPPRYIKNIAAYKEGSDGIVVYFILADSTGAMTVSDGIVNLIISEMSTSLRANDKPIILYERVFIINKKRF